MSTHVKPGSMLLSRNVSALRLQLVAAEYLTRLGARIAQARDAKGWTQPQLARALEALRRRDDPEAANIDASTVSRWERGKVEPGPQMKDYLVEALERPWVWFITEEPDKSTTPDLSHGSTDGLATEVRDRLTAMEQQIAALREMIASGRDEGGNGQRQTG